MTEVDNELLQNFLDESDEMVNEVENHSGLLQTEPHNFDHIHSIFRAVHSLKGNSSFFDLTEIQSFCHTFENFLDLIREKKIEITPQIISVILEGSDHLKNIFSRLDSKTLSVSLKEEESEFLKNLDEKISFHNEEDMMERLRIELLKYFAKAKTDGNMEGDSVLKEIHDVISGVAPEILSDRRRADDGGDSKWLYGELDVTREYMDLRSFLKDANDENLGDDAYDRFMNITNSIIAKHSSAEMAEAVSLLEELKEEFEMFYQEEIGVDESLTMAITSALDKYSENIVEIKPEKAPEVLGGKGDGPESAEAVERTKTVRINESLLDDFIDHVGELININELFNYLQRRLDSGDLDELALDFKNTNQAFHELSNQLQKSLYEIRKAPVGLALNKLPRIARKISKNSGKSISLIITGEETEVDKSLLGILETMLVHCIRNSADHGIEPSDERLAAGKAADGKIMIHVHSDENKLFIRFSDDGRGVDIDKVLKLAHDRNLVSSGSAANLSDQAILDFLLLPGFSTADKVTETSGRGVGMDVLASGVREMNGDMTLKNDPGKGLSISIAVPLTYSSRIKLGLTMRVGSNMFLISAESVRESFRASKEDVNTVEGKGEMVKRWGNIYPLIRLSDLLKVDSVYENVWDAICVLVEIKGSAVCLLVDEMLGQRQIVYKELAVQTRKPCAFEGISILDGRSMALILSVDGIIKQFQE